jgi:hypothetical protein
MVFLNVVAWITILLGILVSTISMLLDEKSVNRFIDFIVLLGYVGTLIAYINK